MSEIDWDSQLNYDINKYYEDRKVKKKKEARK